MTYTKFKKYVSTNPTATYAEVLKEFPKERPIILLAWMSRYAAEIEHTQ